MIAIRLRTDFPFHTIFDISNTTDVHIYIFTRQFKIPLRPSRITHKFIYLNT